MAINPVSFSSQCFSSRTQEDFEQMLTRPQSYVRQDIPAATGIEVEPKQGKSVGKTIAKVLLGTGIAAGLLLLGKKFGAFNTTETTNKLLKPIKNGLNAAATFIEKGFQKITGLFKGGAGSETVENTKRKITGFLHTQGTFRAKDPEKLKKLLSSKA